MTSKVQELGDFDNAGARSAGGWLRSVGAKLRAVPAFPKRDRVKLLYRLVGDIHALEGMVEGGQDERRERELSATFQEREAGHVGKILPPFGFWHPIRNLPEPSTDWGALAYHHVRRARMALESGEEVAFWREFYAARRMELFGLADLGEVYLEMQAHSITLEAAGLAARNGLLRLDQPRKQAILNILGDETTSGRPGSHRTTAGLSRRRRTGWALRWTCSTNSTSINV